MISCYHLSLGDPRAGGALLLDDVSFEIPTNAWAEVLGRAGSGKSLLFGVCSLRYRAKGASLIVGKRNLARLTPGKLAQVRATIGSCAQPPVLLERRSVIENLLLPFVVRGEQDGALGKIEETLERLELRGLRDVPVHATTPQERQLVGLMRACLGRPKVLLLDDAIAGLDPLYKKRALSLISGCHRQGATVVLFGRERVAPRAVDVLELHLEDGHLRPVERAGQTPTPEAAGRRR